MALGAPSVVRIPVPGSRNLAISLSPRRYRGSTSTVFIQDKTGRIHLRLDYGFNVETQSVNYHWNLGTKQKGGMKADYGIADHQVATPAEAQLYEAARYYKWGGRVLVVVGAVLDGIEIMQSSSPLRTATAKASAWALAWMGCEVGGELGAGAGTLAAPGPGTIVGGFFGCIVGAGIGYTIGQNAGAAVYDWAEGTSFRPLPRESEAD